MQAAPTEDYITNQRQAIERTERDTLPAFSQFSSKIWIYVTSAAAVPLSSLEPRRLQHDRRVADNLQINQQKPSKNIPEQIQRQSSYVKALYRAG